MKHLGSCLCGEVQYEVHGDFDGFFLCHCKFCQKDTGSAHAANLFSTRGQLRVLSGQNHISNFNLPNTRHAKSFCSRCGSALPSIQMDSAILVVPAGSLDTEVPMMPQAHIFTSSKASWDHRLENIQAFETFPDRAE